MHEDRRFVLAPDRPCWLDCAEGTELVVLDGTLWATRRGSRDDWFVCAGQGWRPGAGRVLVEAVGATCTLVCRASRSAQRRPWWRQWASRAGASLAWRRV